MAKWAAEYRSNGQADDVPLPDEPPDNHHAGQQDRADDDPNAALLGDIFTAKWLDGQTFPDIEFTVDDLITEGANILVAAPKAGKSWLAADLALAVTQGGIALGAIPVKKRRVLYLALEDGKRRLQKRLRQLNHGVELPEWLELKLMIDPRLVTATILVYLQQHRRLHCDEPPPWVIIDTFGKVKRDKSPGTEPYLHDYRSGAELKTAIEALSGASLLLIHHDRKAEAADYVDAVSGTHGVAGAMDTVLVLARERGSDNAVLKVTGRDIPEAEYALTSDRANGAVHWTIVGADLDAAKAEADRQRCDRAAEAKGRNLGERSLNAVKFVNSRAETTVADLAGYLDIDRKATGDLLRELFDRDHIGKVGRGVYRPLFSPQPEPLEVGPESPESPENAGQGTETNSGQGNGSPESPENDSPANSGLSGHADRSPENRNTHLPANSGLSGLSGVIPDAHTREKISGGPATLIRHSAVFGVSEKLVRKFTVGVVKPYAQHDAAVSVDFVEPRKRTWRGTTYTPGDLEYLIVIEAGGETVYDSRTEIPCDMDKWNATSAEWAGNRPGRVIREGEQ